MSALLAIKIAKAALDVGGKLNPDKRNQEQRYDYLSADKILSVCGQALFTQGVAVVPEVVTQDIQVFEYTDQYNKTKRRYDCRVEFVFHITDGELAIEKRWFGMGSDYSVPDKALYKAITSGHKYFLMKLLCVGAGNEDGEHDEPRSEGPAAEVRKPVEPPPAAKPNGNGKPPAAETKPANGNGKAPDDAAPSEAAWKAWTALVQEAEGLGIIPTEPPAQVKVGSLRKLYGELQSQVEAAKMPPPPEPPEG